jgi:hypothetical protein
VLVLGGLLVGAAWAAGPVVGDGTPDAARALQADERTLRDAKVGTDGAALLDFFRQMTLTDARVAAVRALIRQLGDDSFEARQKASAELAAQGPVALPLLREALRDPDVEIDRRAEECIHQIEQFHNPALAPAALRLLAARRPAGTAEVLLAYVPFADNESLAEEVREALARAAFRDGKPDPALTAALTDRSPARRAAAGAALCRAGAPEQRAAGRKLLQDTDPVVRLRVALALAAAHDKDAVPILIDLLTRLPAPQAAQAEDLLFRAAGDHPPALPTPSEDEGRHKAQKAWAAWWQEAGPKLDVARLDPPARQLGYTMMILLEENRLIEVDAANKTRWQITGLELPLDAQMLPGDRVLVAENNGNRITERDLRPEHVGEVLWEVKVEAPLMAQRLPDGHTFIGSRTRLLEVDREGRELKSWSRPNGELFMRAQKLPGGDIACVVQPGLFVRMNEAGKDLQTFPVDIHTFGGRLEVLPSGRVLVPELMANKVVEQDAQGKVGWQVDFEQPIVATRLPNGNTLVTSFSYSLMKAVELDRQGNHVWEYQANTRITRAWRR